eukprot:GHVL01014412.1.p1 GENE.GHVL01014412.1~~GHVL01014412.1.p1  ORF type:complete len:256 (+),score=34.63 GHVL01014412.1:172-939(+)
MATGSNDQLIHIWKLTRKHETDIRKAATLIGSQGIIRSLQFTQYPSSSVTVASCSSGDSSVSIWSVTGGCSSKLKDRLTVDTNDTSIRCLSLDNEISKDWRLWGSTTNGKAVQWDVRSSVAPQTTLISQNKDMAHTISLVSNGGNDLVCIGTEDGGVCLWDTRSTVPLCYHKPKSVHQGACRSVCISPEGGLLASGGMDGSLCLTRVTDSAILLKTSYHDDRIVCTKWHPTIPQLACSTASGYVRVHSAIVTDNS